MSKPHSEHLRFNQKFSLKLQQLQKLRHTPHHLLRIQDERSIRSSARSDLTTIELKQKLEKLRQQTDYYRRLYELLMQKDTPNVLVAREYEREITRLKKQLEQQVVVNRMMREQREEVEVLREEVRSLNDTLERVSQGARTSREKRVNSQEMSTSREDLIEELREENAMLRGHLQETNRRFEQQIEKFNSYVEKIPRSKEDSKVQLKAMFKNMSLYFYDFSKQRQKYEQKIIDLLRQIVRLKNQLTISTSQTALTNTQCQLYSQSNLCQHFHNNSPV